MKSIPGKDKQPPKAAMILPTHSVAELRQKTFVGQLSLQLSSQECAILQLLTAPKGDMLHLWKLFWEGIPHYDDLPVSSRLLLPAAVRRLQHLQVSGWQEVHGLDLTFLTGLPRYFWAKNQYYLNQTRLIAQGAHAQGIRIVALKGMAELLEGSITAMMRSTRDLDLLVRPEELDVFREVVRELGYSEFNSQAGRLLNLPIPRDQFWFRSPDKKLADIDAHVLVDKYRFGNQITRVVWEGIRPVAGSEGLFVPAPQARFWIAVANVFRAGNWAEGSHLKYLDDAFHALSGMQQTELEETLRQGREEGLLHDWQEQVIQLGLQLRIFGKETTESLRTNVPARQPAVPVRGLEKSGTGFALKASTASFIHGRIDAFALTVGMFKRHGISLNGLLFLLIAPLRSLGRAGLTRFRKRNQPSAVNPRTGQPIPPPPPIFVRWRLGYRSNR